ncbi:hypothetical protein F4803DRAFT_515037 [Xylaria telfairii]|nr:hypothetical protein F4803DRAFT_515037 [Xylaria telfairii]
MDMTQSSEGPLSYGSRVVEAAILDGLSTDLSHIDPHRVRRQLKPKSKDAYAREMEIWNAYVAKFPGHDPRDVRVMKHFAEVIGRGIKAKFEAKNRDNNQRASTFTVRNKMRRFFSMWERQMHVDITDEVKASMTPYIEGELAEKIGLSRERKAPTFFTIESYVQLQLYLWTSDPHDYWHEGNRVDATNLLNNHCFTSARLQEVCGAKYEDLVCLIGWKDGEPDIKLDFKRKICKGLDYKQPEHPLAERLIGLDGLPPPLFAQPMVHWLVNIISSGALRDYKTIEEVLDAVPGEGESLCFLEWAHKMRDMPVFPAWTESGPQNTAKTPGSWADQVSKWAKRTGFLLGLPIHAIRREILLKVNDSGAAIGQVAKFAAHRNVNTLVGRYLPSLTTVDGAACYLGLQPRKDLTDEFRTATLKRNPDLQQSMPSKMQDELKSRDEYVAITRQIEDIALQINTTTDAAAVTRLKGERSKLYNSRTLLRRKEQEKFRQNQERVPEAQREAHYQNDWRRSHFDRIRHMIPERDRLARNISLRVPLRSPEGISVMKDLIALRTGNNPNWEVAYQEVIRPIHGVCPAPGCSMEMDSIPCPARWKHVFNCCMSSLKRSCSVKLTSMTEPCLLGAISSNSGMPLLVPGTALSTSGTQICQHSGDYGNTRTEAVGGIISLSVSQTTSKAPSCWALSRALYHVLYRPIRRRSCGIISETSTGFLCLTL